VYRIGIQVNVKISDSTNKIVFAQASTRLAIEQPKPVVACHAAYTVQSEWQGGFTAALSITNTGQVNVNSWTLTFTFGGDQKLGTVWGASGTQNGNIGTLKNAAYDAAIAPGQTISGIGFTGTWTNSDAAPIGFNLNGTLCS
jgi:endoglucanase